MDASEILVAVMIAAAVAWLVWAELHTRRNRASDKQAESDRSKSLERPKTRDGYRQQGA